jgi:hypothetical protein
LEHHVDCLFDLAVALRVGDRGVIDVDGVFLAKVPEDGAGESFAQVDDDPFRHAKAMCDVSDEFYRFFRRYFRNRSDFNPLGEFVDGHQYMLVDAWGGTKRSYNVETPHSEGPRWRDGVQGLSWQVLLFGKELASFAPLDEDFCVSHGRGPVKSRSVCLADQVSGCRVAATFTAVNLS